VTKRSFEGATIIAGAGMEVITAGHLVIEDGRIAALGRGPAPAGLTAGGEVVAAGDMLLVPAFINAHTHIGDVVAKEAGLGLPSWDVVMPPDGVKVRVLREADDDVLVAAVRDAVSVMLRSGTTTFADFREGGAHGAELLRRATAGTGVRALAFGRHGSHPPHAEDDLEANRGGLAPGLLEELDSMLDTLPGWGVPLAFDVTDEGLRQTRAAVRARGKLLATH